MTHMTGLKLSYFGYVKPRSSFLEKVEGKKRTTSSKVDGFSYSGDECTVRRPEWFGFLHCHGEKYAKRVDTN